MTMRLAPQGLTIPFRAGLAVWVPSPPQLLQPPQPVPAKAEGNGAIRLPSARSQGARPARSNGNAIDTRNRRMPPGKRLLATWMALASTASPTTRCCSSNDVLMPARPRP